MSLRPTGRACSTNIKLRLFLVVWNRIWWGENRILLPVWIFNSTIKKPTFLLYKSKSGTPKLFQTSSGVMSKSGQFFLNKWYSFFSGFTVHWLYTVKPFKRQLRWFFYFNKGRIDCNLLNFILRFLQFIILL